MRKLFETNDCRTDHCCFFGAGFSALGTVAETLQALRGSSRNVASVFRIRTSQRTPTMRQSWLRGKKPSVTTRYSGSASEPASSKSSSRGMGSLTVRESTRRRATFFGLRRSTRRRQRNTIRAARQDAQISQNDLRQLPEAQSHTVCSRDAAYQVFPRLDTVLSRVM